MMMMAMDARHIQCACIRNTPVDSLVGVRKLAAAKRVRWRCDGGCVGIFHINLQRFLTPAAIKMELLLLCHAVIENPYSQMYN